ncbi:MAG: type II toxin-antitoxin system PemK/MazF family toxin [Cyanobacteria bacterium]|nr:type II toxin-antitoxin system PemK/MazF family toxin [Cyanobacteriota bacterium]
MKRVLKFGDVVSVRLPTNSPRGHEQEGFRPAIVVGVPGNFTQPRFPLVFIVPVTSDHAQPWVLGPHQNST